MKLGLWRGVNPWRQRCARRGAVLRPRRGAAAEKPYRQLVALVGDGVAVGPVVSALFGRCRRIPWLRFPSLPHSCGREVGVFGLISRALAAGDRAPPATRETFTGSAASGASSIVPMRVRPASRGAGSRYALGFERERAAVESVQQGPATERPRLPGRPRCRPAAPGNGKGISVPPGIRPWAGRRQLPLAGSSRRWWSVATLT